MLSRGTLYHLLSNPVYIGKDPAQGGTPLPESTNLLWTRDTWTRVSDLLKHNKVNRKRTRNVPSGRVLLGRLKTSQRASLTLRPTRTKEGDATSTTRCDRKIWIRLKAQSSISLRRRSKG